MKKIATLFLLPLLFSGCAALIPFEKANRNDYPCQHQLEKAIQEMVALNFKLALEIKLMATNEVSCESGMANVAVIVHGSPNKKSFFFPGHYYTNTHIHFNPEHGKYDEYEEQWFEMRNKDDWFKDWCMDFIRWYDPKDWHKQGCGSFGEIGPAHEIQPHEHA